MRKFRPILLLRTAALLCAVFLLAHVTSAAEPVSFVDAAQSFLKTGLFFIALPAALVAIALHQSTRRAIVRLAPLAGEEFDRLTRYLRARLPRRRAAAQPAPEDPAEQLPMLLAATKHRLDALHRFLRDGAPELLPAFAEYGAAMNRLQSELAARPEAHALARPHLTRGLDTLETATGKLSVVLAGAPDEYALGSYCDTLERLTGEALACVYGIRTAWRSGESGVSLAGELGHS